MAYNGQDGWGHGAVRLPVIYVGGPDTFVRVQHWSHWTASSAFARGTLWVDNCQPNCAAGHYARYPAAVSLSRVAAHQGASYFSRMRLRYSPRPARTTGSAGAPTAARRSRCGSAGRPDQPGLNLSGGKHLLTCNQALA